MRKRRTERRQDVSHDEEEGSYATSNMRRNKARETRQYKSNRRLLNRSSQRTPRQSSEDRRETSNYREPPEYDVTRASSPRPKRDNGSQQRRKNYIRGRGRGPSRKQHLATVHEDREAKATIRSEEGSENSEGVWIAWDAQQEVSLMSDSMPYDTRRGGLAATPQKSSKGQSRRSDSDPTSSVVNGNMISAKIFKKSKRSKTGISFRKKSDGKLIVSKIASGSLFASTPLRSGDELVHINNQICMKMSAKEAADLVKLCQGPVRIIAKRPQPSDRLPIQSSDASVVSVTVNRRSKRTPAGLEVTKDEEGRLMVKRIHPGGLFETTSLEEGDEIMSINNIDCDDMEPEDLASIFNGSAGSIRVDAKRKKTRAQAADDRVPFYSVTVRKKTKNAIAGLELTKTSDNRMIVARINPRGLFANTAMQVGDEIISINSVECEGKKLRDVAAMFKRDKGIITVLLKREPNGGRGLMGAESMDVSEDIPSGRFDKLSDPVPFVVSKSILPFMSITINRDQAKNSETGLKLKRNKRGRIIVSGIKNTSLFSDTGLQVGDELVSINSVSCKGKRLQVIAELLEDNSSATLTVLAKRGGINGTERYRYEESSDDDSEEMDSQYLDRNDQVVRFGDAESLSYTAYNTAYSKRSIWTNMVNGCGTELCCRC